MSQALAALLALALATPGPPQGSGLAIVAPRRFHEALEPLARERGWERPVALLAVEDALRCEGRDAPEKLKRQLFERWATGWLGYVLLVGDADVLPVRYMVLDRNTEAAFHYAFYPSDLYYADLARAGGGFEDWNAEKEGFRAGYFGEVRGEHDKDGVINADRVHYLPEVAVGRWPVSTEAEVRLLVEKTLAYGRAPRRRRAAFVVTDGWVDCRPLMERLAGALEPRFRVDRLLFGRSTSPDEARTIGLLNEGIDLAVHAGHGSDHGWDRCFTVGSLTKLTNSDRLPVLLSVGCSTARLATLPPYEAYVDTSGVTHAGTNQGEVFTAPPPPPAPLQDGARNPTGLGEQMLRAGSGGAVAYIGCNTGSQPCALTLAEGFTDALAKGGPARLGDLWVAALRHYYTKEKLDELVPTKSWYPPSIFFQGMKFMVYGDPCLELGPRPRARDLGLTFDPLPPGPLNAITDVDGVAVGHATVIEGETVRTGVTVVVPRLGESTFRHKVPAAVVTGNGFGKAAGFTQVEELGVIEAPIALTNTLAVGTVLQAMVNHSLTEPGLEEVRSVNVVVGETNDGWLNDIRAVRITREHVEQAWSGASRGPVAEGAVGAGTGTMCLGHKGGIGTASRVIASGPFTLGVLVQANFGGRLRISGTPLPEIEEGAAPAKDGGSCMIVLATDAPLDARQLKRVARRTFLGLGRVGSVMAHGSGDYTIAFSTFAGNVSPATEPATRTVTVLAEALLTPFFEAAVGATEEAVINALLAARPMRGRAGHEARALDSDRISRLARR